MAKSGRASDLGFSVGRIHAYYGRVSGGAFEDAVILSNHDQNRVMSQLGGDVGKAKAAAALLLTMPGKPCVYYGEEIGMEGVKPDENLRRPMRWDEVAAQLDDPDSLLHRYKTLLHWRKREPVLARGQIASHAVDNDRVAAYLRVAEDERALVLVNLSGNAERASVGEGAAGSACANRRRRSFTASTGCCSPTIRRCTPTPGCGTGKRSSSSSTCPAQKRPSPCRTGWTWRRRSSCWPTTTRRTCRRRPAGWRLRRTMRGCTGWRGADRAPDGGCPDLGAKEADRRGEGAGRG